MKRPGNTLGLTNLLGHRAGRERAQLFQKESQLSINEKCSSEWGGMGSSPLRSNIYLEIPTPLQSLTSKEDS